MIGEEAAEQDWRKEADTLPVFKQPWWTERAGTFPDSHRITVASGSTEIGSFPYVVRTNRLGFREGLDLNWTHLGGPVASASARRAVRIQVYAHLIQQLPHRVSYRFMGSPGIPDAELIDAAFIQAGFSRKLVCNFELDPTLSLAMRIHQLKNKNRRRAARELLIEPLGAARFVELYARNLRVASYGPLEAASALIEAGFTRVPAQVRVTAARCAAGAQEYGYEAAIACVWDQERYYYWLSTRRPSAAGSRGAHPDAVKLLILDAIRHAHDLGLRFDADGATTSGALHLYGTVLGLRPTYRLLYQRHTRLRRLWLGARRLRALWRCELRQQPVPTDAPMERGALLSRRFVGARPQERGRTAHADVGYHVMPIGFT